MADYVTNGILERRTPIVAGGSTVPPAVAHGVPDMGLGLVAMGTNRYSTSNALSKTFNLRRAVQYLNKDIERIAREMGEFFLYSSTCKSVPGMNTLLITL